MNMAGPSETSENLRAMVLDPYCLLLCLIAFGSLVIGHTVFTPSQIYRSQAILMVGATIPLIANIAYLIGRGDAFLGSILL